MARIGPVEEPENKPWALERRANRVAQKDRQRALEGEAEPPLRLMENKFTPYVTPLVVKSAQDVEDIFRRIAPSFEGRETEQNWRNREKNVRLLRELVMGNAPLFHSQTFFPALKAQLDGIFKAVFSLRTTLCTNGCYLFIDLAYWYGPEMDGMVEIVVQNMLRVCIVSKKLTADNGNKAIDTIMEKALYKERLVQHIHGALTDKNPQLRAFAAGWLRTIVSRHTTDKAAIEHGNGLGLIAGCFKLGLKDANPNVREKMRLTCRDFLKVWPDRTDR